MSRARARAREPPRPRRACGGASGKLYGTWLGASGGGELAPEMDAVVAAEFDGAGAIYAQVASRDQVDVAGHEPVCPRVIREGPPAAKRQREVSVCCVGRAA